MLSQFPAAALAFLLASSALASARAPQAKSDEGSPPAPPTQQEEQPVADITASEVLQRMLADPTNAAVPEWGEQALELLADAPDALVELNVRNVLANYFMDVGQLDLCATHAERLLELVREHGIDNDVMRSLNLLAVCHRHRGHPHLSLPLIEEMIEIAVRVGIPPLYRARMYNNLGAVHEAQDDMPASLEAYKKALALNDEAGVEDEMLLTNIGLVTLRLGRARDAIAIYDQALAVVASKGEVKPFVLAGLYSNIASAHAELGEVEEARTSYAEAIRLASDEQAPNQLAEAYVSLGMLEHGQGNSKQGLDFVRKGHDIFRRREMADRAAESLARMGSILHDLGQREEAFEIASASLDSARSLDSKRILIAALDTMIEVHQGLGETEQALERTRERIRLSDTLFALEHSTALAEFNAQLGSELQEKELLELRRAQIEQTARLAERRSERNLLLAGAVLLLLIGALGWSRWLIRRRSEQALSVANSELRTSQQHLLETLEQVEQLHGLLPVCSSCKAIRDSSGAWQDLEDFLASKTDASLTHSICPSCHDELYAHLEPEPNRSEFPAGRPR